MSEKSNLRISKLENIFISQIDEEGVDSYKSKWERKRERKINKKWGKHAFRIWRTSVLLLKVAGLEMWTCVDCTMILHQHLHFLLDALVPLGDVDVQRVVTAGFAVGPPTPLLKGWQEADARFRDHVVDWKTHMHNPTIGVCVSNHPPNQDVETFKIINKNINNQRVWINYVESRNYEFKCWPHVGLKSTQLFSHSS